MGTGKSILFISSKTAMKITREKIEKSFEIPILKYCLNLQTVSAL
jgi:hypothetical protein